MALGWIEVEKFPFDCFLLLERFQIRYVCMAESGEKRAALAIALRYNPSVKWYFMRRCPECAAFVEQIVKEAPNGLDVADIRAAEIRVMMEHEDFVVYTHPEIMDSSCNFIYGWDESRLFELADFTDKVVLDIGSGSGRLAFAAAKVARMVYASEPVSTLREFMRDKIATEGIKNVRVVDGLVENLPYPDDTFDIVMSGHVVGDDYEAEMTEIMRVVKPGGWVLDCPGEEDRKGRPSSILLADGFEVFHYESKFDGDVYRYRKQK